MPTAIVYQREGFCPICDKPAKFTSRDPWYRDHLLCGSCENGSVPRERALMHVLRTSFPQWRELRIHGPLPHSAAYRLL